MTIFGANIEVLKNTARHIVKSRESDRNRTASDQLIVFQNSEKKNPFFINRFLQTLSILKFWFLFSNFRFI